MLRMLKITLSLGCLLLALAATRAETLADDLSYDKQPFTADGATWQLSVLAGYQLELLVEMPSPRMLTKIGDDVFLAGSNTGQIYRIKPPYRAAEVLATLKGYPHSVALRDDELLVGKTAGVYRASYKAYRGVPLTDKDFERLVALPGGSGHASRTLAVGPDGRLYVSVGITGNCSNQYMGEGYNFNKQRGGIWVINEARGQPAQLEPYTTGLRNPIGYAWHPESGVLYASNNGPDHHGYELPREYFSRIAAGSFHGMPWYWLNAENQLVRDNCIGSPPPRRDATLPVATFAARSAPMGVAFVPDGALQADMTGSAAVAIHGSWATQPSGGYWGNSATRRPPKIVLVRFDDGEAAAVLPLLEGLQDAQGRRLARPVGVAFASDGALYFTSDGGVIEGLFRLVRKD